MQISKPKRVQARLKRDTQPLISLLNPPSRCTHGSEISTQTTAKFQPLGAWHRPASYLTLTTPLSHPHAPVHPPHPSPYRFCSSPGQPQLTPLSFALGSARQHGEAADDSQRPSAVVPAPGNPALPFASLDWLLLPPGGGPVCWAANQRRCSLLPPLFPLSGGGLSSWRASVDGGSGCAARLEAPPPAPGADKMAVGGSDFAHPVKSMPWLQICH